MSVTIRVLKFVPYPPDELNSRLKERYGLAVSSITALEQRARECPGKAISCRQVGIGSREFNGASAIIKFENAQWFILE